jgi:hypothetical protein
VTLAASPSARAVVEDGAPVIIAIDPGPERSGVIVLGPRGGVRALAIEPNETIATYLRERRFTAEATHLVIEKIAAMGMAVGAEVFETVYWSGIFAEAGRYLTVDRLPRSTIKVHLCGTVKAKDANIRQALIDRYGGDSHAIGRKAEPGPLYGIRTHLWPALAVAVTYRDGLVGSGL